MKCFTGIAWVLAALTSIVGLIGETPKAQAADRPNVLWIIGEDMGPELSCYGTPEVWTPTLDQLAARADRRLAETGVTIVDVQINRTELPEKSLDAAYGQMREQQHAIARVDRVQGERLSREARAGAERQARTTLAEARAFAERARGEGDARAARTYAEAFSRDAEFYAFVRSLEAYRMTLGEGTTRVLPPDHEFFRYLGLDARAR